MSLLRTLLIVFCGGMAVVWVASYFRPLVLRGSWSPQEVAFVDASHGRLRLTLQRVRPAVVLGLNADVSTPL